MARAFICDRCGKAFNPGFFPVISCAVQITEERLATSGTGGKRTFHLCKECAEAFHGFIGEADPEEVGADDR